MKDWDTVVAYALTLTGAECGTTYGKPAVKVNGKMIVATTAPTSDSFVLHAPIEEKEMLIDTDPATFWETDHYRGWPAVLVRYGTNERTRIERQIVRAWWDRLSKRARAEAGDRP